MLDFDLFLAIDVKAVKKDLFFLEIHSGTHMIIQKFEELLAVERFSGILKLEFKRLNLYKLN